MTELDAIGESLASINGSVRPNGHRGVVKQAEHNRLPKGKNVETSNVTMERKKPDTSPVVETFVRRWGEEPSATKESHGVEGKAKGFSYECGLNMSDFDCCDTEVTILEEKVLVTVAATAATIEKWLQEHQGERRFGFDIEWKPTKQKGDYSDAATLQLSTEKHCLLVQLLFVDHVPKCLKNILADPTVVLGGVGIKVHLPIHLDFHILQNIQNGVQNSFVNI